MYNWSCSACGYAIDRPDKPPDDLPCPKCGKRMDVRLVENKNSSQIMWLYLLGILAASATWYGVKVFTEKPNDPQPAPVQQQQPAK